MEYKPLQFLENTYPNPNNYVSTGVEKTTLNGIYPEKNKIDFNLPSISELKYVEGTEFNFVLAIFKDYKDTKPVYYTSEQYYYTLQNSILEGNPYFSQASFNPQNIVSYVIEPPLKVYTPLHKEEIKPRVNMRQNIFINTGSFVEYDNLVTYIDWMVSQVSPLDDDNFGVLKAETIAGWDVLNGNYATGEISTGVSASFGIGAEFVLITETEGNDLKFQQQKLDRLKKEIEKTSTIKITMCKVIINKKIPINPIKTSLKPEEEKAEGLKIDLLLFFNLIFTKSIFHDFSWISSNYSKRGNIFSYHRTTTNNSPIRYFNTRHYSRFGTNPNIVFYNNITFT